MHQNQEINTLRLSTKQQFDQTQNAVESTELYIHKNNFNNILVYAQNPQQKKHCYRIKCFEVSQYEEILNIPEKINQQGYKKAYKKVSKNIKFDGEVIFTLLSKFNEILVSQIKEYVDYHSQELISWFDHKISDIYLVNKKFEDGFGCQFSFLQVKSVLYPKSPYFYFQTKKLHGKIGSEVPRFEETENLHTNSNFMTSIFSYIQQARQKQKLLKKHKK